MSQGLAMWCVACSVLQTVMPVAAVAVVPMLLEE